MSGSEKLFIVVPVYLSERSWTADVDSKIWNSNVAQPWKGGPHSTVGIICTLVEIVLTDWPKTGEVS